MNTAERALTNTVKLIFAIGLAGILAGCTIPKRGSTAGPILTERESRESGLTDYREILSDPGPF